jgi:hypothetical protein
VTAKKKKKENEPVCDCNYLACVIATRKNVRLQKKEPDFVCVVEKRNLVVWNMIASLGSK